MGGQPPALSCPGGHMKSYVDNLYWWRFVFGESDAEDPVSAAEIRMVPVRRITCPVCGRKYLPGRRTCTKCGSRLKSDED